MKKTSKPQKDVDKCVESEYWTEVTFTCPVRGKVTEKIKVKKIKSQPTPHVPLYELEILKEDSQED